MHTRGGRIKWNGPNTQHVGLTLQVVQPRERVVNYSDGWWCACWPRTTLVVLTHEGGDVLGQMPLSGRGGLMQSLHSIYPSLPPPISGLLLPLFQALKSCSSLQFSTSLSLLLASLFVSKLKKGRKRKRQPWWVYSIYVFLYSLSPYCSRGAFWCGGFCNGSSLL